MKLKLRMLSSKSRHSLFAHFCICLARSSYYCILLTHIHYYNNDNSNIVTTNFNTIVACHLFAHPTFNPTNGLPWLSHCLNRPRGGSAKPPSSRYQTNHQQKSSRLRAFTHQNRLPRCPRNALTRIESSSSKCGAPQNISITVRITTGSIFTESLSLALCSLALSPVI